MTGRWLDLWDHPEHDTCKILKGVRELDDGVRLPGSPKLPSTAQTSADKDEIPDGNRFTAAKVIGAPPIYVSPTYWKWAAESLRVFGCAREVSNTPLASCAAGKPPTRYFLTRHRATKDKPDAFLR